MVRFVFYYLRITISGKVNGFLAEKRFTKDLLKSNYHHKSARIAIVLSPSPLTPSLSPSTLKFLFDNLEKGLNSEMPKR